MYYAVVWQHTVSSRQGELCVKILEFIVVCPIDFNTMNFHTNTYRVSQEEWTKFGRVFLMLKYTDITQNTYIQS